ncbi:MULTISPECIES: hypothetical protein [Clostridia]|uniref:hypothetical protein n=1 Tax=Clostridia TaxID=186801 RepID=UPI00067F0408|nr:MULTISPECIES: hypothetical protein [Clostridia]
MTYKELTDYIFSRMQHGDHKMSEQVPADVADMIKGGPGHIDPARYVASKCDIKRGVDAVGQKNT